MRDVQYMDRVELLEHIWLHPEKHQHTFAQLQACATRDGALDTGVLRAHEGIVPDKPECDVIAGPCGCGATHG